MIRRLTAGLVCLCLMLAITPLDKAFGTSCPGKSASECSPAPTPNPTENCPDAEHSGDSCPDDCQCLCCPGLRILHQRNAAPTPTPRIPTVCDAPLAKSFNPRDFVDTIFRPPRRS